VVDALPPTITTRQRAVPCLSLIRLTNFGILKHDGATGVQVGELGEVVDDRVNNDPEVPRLVVLGESQQVIVTIGACSSNQRQWRRVSGLFVFFRSRGVGPLTGRQQTYLGNLVDGDGLERHDDGV
jgi:hypothetical protein